MSDTARIEAADIEATEAGEAREIGEAGEAAGFGAAAFADAETREILNLLGDEAAGGSCCGGSCCSV
ncbi:MAG: hypothetical protein D3X82_09860 [Candidatus Leucobacter sulfamidivorax]|nr:hypothetical protein [Candidatus Leucobacter sulfamidivorax]